MANLYRETRKRMGISSRQARRVVRAARRGRWVVPYRKVYGHLSNINRRNGE